MKYKPRAHKKKRPNPLRGVSAATLAESMAFFGAAHAVAAGITRAIFGSKLDEAAVRADERKKIFEELKRGSPLETGDARPETEKKRWE